MSSKAAVSWTPGEYLDPGAIQDPQAVWRLWHIEGLEQRYCPHLGSLKIGNILRDPLKRGMRTVADPYSEELDRELHECRSHFALSLREQRPRPTLGQARLARNSG
jgi:hypothetical protein